MQATLMTMKKNHSEFHRQKSVQKNSQTFEKRQLIIGIEATLFVQFQAIGLFLCTAVFPKHQEQRGVFVKLFSSFSKTDIQKCNTAESGTNSGPDRVIS